MNKFNKVASVTFTFWLLKILATTLGETSGDLLAITLNMGYLAGLLITAGFLCVTLVGQLTVERFRPLLFWAAIVGTTTVGTEISDLMDRTLHLGYTAGSLILAGFLMTTLCIWRLTLGEIRVFPIFDRQEELFYWIAILFSNSLGTAFGDYLSDSLSLGYVTGALITAAVIIVVMSLHFATRINEILLFWIAFVFTRPFGATFGDFLTKPAAKGGLSLNTASASVIALALMLLIIAFSSQSASARHPYDVEKRCRRQDD